MSLELIAVSERLVNSLERSIGSLFLSIIYTFFYGGYQHLKIIYISPEYIKLSFIDSVPSILIVFGTVFIKKR